MTETRPQGRGKGSVTSALFTAGTQSSKSLLVIHTLARIVPTKLRRRLEVVLIDHGFPTMKKHGRAGIKQLGHRGYVGRAGTYEAMGRVQFEFLIQQGLQPSDVLCDVGCGSLRGGRHFIGFLDRSNYLGLEGEGELLERGIEYEASRELIHAKAPEFVISYEFEFHRFTKSPTFALACSLFTHLNEQDIALCLKNLADRVSGSCRFFASFFESERRRPNFKKSHSQLGFYYTREQMETMGEDTGWESAYIGDWESPAGQKMIEYSLMK